ncbi:CBF/Mak21 family-domain-containing protein [Suillus paluster]|uniref:CBF/Mak21 family-domain-containing protein n=1 Tax=Suillus paluster TaxID=48578 RepID=UPI001B878F74|nr:CBF/Mak21 family-domain-containing protein [Suillus paluster]KAG1756402.1 CBF/Mak21 family-domain-containing protein [Suillus paluster]
MPVRSLPPPTKRRKTTVESVSIKSLEAQLTSAVTDNGTLNPLADLLMLAHGTSDAREMSKAVYSIYRVFVLIISRGMLVHGGDDAAKQVRKWIWEKLDSYVELLVGLLQDEEPALRKSSLEILFSLLKHLSTSLTKSAPTPQPQFHLSHFKHIVHGILLCPPSPRSKGSSKHDSKTKLDVRENFVEVWFSVYDDIRWCFLREATTVLSKYSSTEYPQLLDNLLSIMEKLSTFPTDQSELSAWWVEELGAKPPKHKTAKGDTEEEDDPEPVDENDEDDWRKFFDEDSNVKDTKKPSIKARAHTLTFHQSLHSLQAHRAVFTRSWLNFLPHLSSVSTSSNRALTTRALNIMHRGVLPHLTRPVLVMDWISACVDLGETVGLLALNALFTLMRDYNLDYPSFFTRLYAFLHRDVLHLKHRARFFRLTELFLSSTHLPATLLASFVKRLSRLSLNAPPAAIIMIIPFTYNILKRHPALMVMIHRTEDNTGTDTDPFIAEEPNPNSTNALDSSLWELHSHIHHYDSAVSTMARIFAEAFTKPGYSMEDFLDHTYGTLIETEVRRKIKKEPALAMTLRKDLFPMSDVVNADDSVSGRDVVSEFWVFG